MLARLVPEPEPENIYDSGAIAIYIMSAESDSYDKVGYIAKEFTCYVHPCLKDPHFRVSVKAICFRTTFNILIMMMGYYLTLTIIIIIIIIIIICL